MSLASEKERDKEVRVEKVIKEVIAGIFPDIKKTKKTYRFKKLGEG